MNKENTLSELFAGAKNVISHGNIKHNIEGNDVSMPTFTLVETKESWNAMAKRVNTQTFISANGFEPKNYEEVREWMEKLYEISKFREEFVNQPKKKTVSIHGDGMQFMQKEL